MKQGNNNEIDLLLRSLAKSQRGQSSLASDGAFEREKQGLSDHLDADELSSFAEGVVPAPARSRFISHLADCESCRGVVVSLTQSSGGAAGSKTLEPQSGAGFWSKMASLFSPPVLRYAVPAIALTAVIAVSFFALRQQNRADFVAKNEATKPVSPASVGEQPVGSPLAQANIEAPAKTRNANEPRVRLEDSSERKAPQDDKPASTKSSIGASDADTANLSSQKSASQPKPYVAGVDRRVFATEPQAAPPPPPKPAVNEADKVGEKEEVVTKRKVQELPVESNQTERNQTRDETGRHGPSRNNNNAIGGAARADDLVIDRVESRAKSKKDSEDESETRTVSGKRFRRQGNAWVDTAYESSRRTINVSRGSEQFRALVADEPVIRTIAERLSGVVIIVSNGRAYRIQ
jgi:putative zinc finger protein